MKHFLFAASAAVLAGGCAAATAAEETERRIVRVETAPHVLVRNGDRRTIEVIGEGGDRTIHVTRGDGDSVITVNGRRIEVRDGVVTVDGEIVTAEHGGVVIVDNDGARVVERRHAGPGVHLFRRGEDGDVRIEMQRMHGEMARAQGEIARAMAERRRGEARLRRVDVERILEEAMGEDRRVRIMRHGDDREMTDEERARVRERLDRVREELAGALGEGRESRRLAMIELDRARGDLSGARRQMVIARAHADRAREEASRWLEEAGIASLRIETVDGERRVWVDGEELEGEALIEWMNDNQIGFLEDRLEGGPGRRHFVFRSEAEAEGHGPRAIFIGPERRVIFPHDRDEDSED